MSRFFAEADMIRFNVKLCEATEQEVWEWLNEMLYIAFIEARKGKLNTVNQQKFEEDRDINLARLTDAVIGMYYRPGRGTAFVILEPVPREIFAAPFADRIIHHFLVMTVEDFWDKRLSPRSSSCRKNKGTLYGVRKLNSDLRKSTMNWHREAWVMKMDLLGYFMSLPREYLYSRVMWGLDKIYPEGGVIYEISRFLWKEVLYDDPTDGVRLKGAVSDWNILPKQKSLFFQPLGRGIVIGNLTSQWVSNMALDTLDRYVYFDLECKYYGRYVDDFYLISENKNDLLKMRDKITEFLIDIGIEVHPKKFYLQPASKGTPFLGVVSFPYRVVLNKRFAQNLWRLNMTIKEKGLGQEQLDSLMSYHGLALHHCHKKTFVRIFGKDIFKDIKKWQEARSQVAAVKHSQR